MFKKARNQAVAEFPIFCAWLDWLAGVALCPSRWPYSEFNREPVVEVLGRVRFIASSVACLEPPSGSISGESG